MPQPGASCTFVLPDQESNVLPNSEQEQPSPVNSESPAEPASARSRTILAPNVLLQRTTTASISQTARGGAIGLVLIDRIFQVLDIATFTAIWMQCETAKRNPMAHFLGAVFAGCLVLNILNNAKFVPRGLLFGVGLAYGFCRSFFQTSKQ